MTRRPVYLDNAATTPVRPEVLEAMLPYLGSEAFGNPSSAHRFGRAARAGIEEARRQVADALGAEPNQVIFTSGGTEADNLAILGAALAARDQGVISAEEYAQWQRKEALRKRVIMVDDFPQDFGRAEIMDKLGEAKPVHAKAA